MHKLAQFVLFRILAQDLRLKEGTSKLLYDYIGLAVDLIHEVP